MRSAKAAASPSRPSSALNQTSPDSRAMIAVLPATRTHSVTGCTIVFLQTRGDMPKTGGNRSWRKSQLRSFSTSRILPLLAHGLEENIDACSRRHEPHEPDHFRCSWHRLVVGFSLISSAPFHDAHLGASLQIRYSIRRNQSRRENPLRSYSTNRIGHLLAHRFEESV